MKMLDEMARENQCLESVDTYLFQRQARVLQSMWRQSHGWPIGAYRGRNIGSYLLMPWAEQSMANFLDDDIRQVVRDVLARDRGGAKRPLIEATRLFSNLLSSQPLAFNLFAHLHLDLQLASNVMREVSNGRIARVTAVDFEFSPGRGDARYTGDHSAFDVYLRFITPAGLSGFAGIEVKYHENLANPPSRHHPRYDEVARHMGCFSPHAYPRLQRKPLQQIWRDHLLAGAHTHVDRFADGFFVFMFPAINEACQRAVTAYQQCLMNDDSFVPWTLETMIQAIGSYCDQPWVAAFADRYLAFDKVLAEQEGSS